MIRKYRCTDCAAVMMCACDEARGRQFLPHQIKAAHPAQTQHRIPVTAGFQPTICRECRGLPIEAHPRAERHGQTSKFRRYYWREISTRTMDLFAEWAKSQGLDIKTAYFAKTHREERARIRRDAMEEIRRLHLQHPKYDMTEESSDAVLKRCQVPILSVEATFVRDPNAQRARLLDGSEVVDTSEFARRHFVRQGYDVLFLESRPFHALFGVFMWLLIQGEDEELRMIGFGERRAYEQGLRAQIWTQLPSDFGSTAYGRRRAQAIDEHFALIAQERDLLWLFDYWLQPSHDLRNYLWAHNDEVIQAGRRLIEVLPRPAFISILRYLVEGYWDRCLGWPDLLVHRPGDWSLVEVKASKDTLSAEQRRWSSDNASLLHLPFKVLKVHRRKTIDGGTLPSDMSGNHVTHPDQAESE